MLPGDAKMEAVSFGDWPDVPDRLRNPPADRVPPVLSSVQRVQLTANRRYNDGVLGCRGIKKQNIDAKVDPVDWSEGRAAIGRLENLWPDTVPTPSKVTSVVIGECNPDCFGESCEWVWEKEISMCRTGSTFLCASRTPTLYQAPHQLRQGVGPKGQKKLPKRTVSLENDQSAAVFR